MSQAGAAALITHMLQCCTTACDAGGTDLTVVQLTSDLLETPMSPPVHLLTQRDALDITAQKDVAQRQTPRLQGFRDRIRLPTLRRYPLPSGCSSDDSEEVRRSELLRVYKDFTVDLHKGVHMTQMGVNQDYSDIHCQILEDLQTLKVDQGSGCIIEFPLSAVSKIYRIVKNDNRWFKAGSLTGPSPMPPLPLCNAEHIVVVEFMRRKLAFVFTDMEAAQGFLMCMELLIRRAQEMCSDGAQMLPFGRRVGKGDNTVAPMFAAYKHGPSGRQPVPATQAHSGIGALLASHTAPALSEPLTPAPPMATPGPVLAKGPEPSFSSVGRLESEGLEGAG